MIGTGWTCRMAALGLALGLAACGGEDADDASDPFVGVFEVVRHDLSQMGCETPMPLVDPARCSGCVVEAPFFKIGRQSLHEASVLTVVDCESATACDDDRQGDAPVDLGGVRLEREEDGVWVGEAHAVSYGGAVCSFRETEWRLEQTDDGVRLVRTAFDASPESPSGMLRDRACLDQADRPPPRAQLDCGAREWIEAVPAGT